MKLPQIHKCLSNDSMRANMTYAVINERGILHATDGRILVGLDLVFHEIKGMENAFNKMIGLHALKRMSGGGCIGFEFEEEFIKIRFSTGVEYICYSGVSKDGIEFEMLDEEGMRTGEKLRYPDVEGVIPTKKEQQPKELSQIAFDAKLMVLAQSAMYGNLGFKCVFYGETRAIMCYSISDDHSCDERDKSFALIMPMQLELN